ncbi:FAD binding domain-containing protein [Pseudolysinimonas yzui]|uniref:FAD-binding molybdopterin dehydrogenase n=1 Tax=Pseudolysinimonas yzui TaxID=2708254 RepID=A0A8J3DYR8_9MICO|nr:FAD binding domain-containing protein [Pseudolysinimonas yzui]GHF05083.1 FAD-binding molybdopterin dehydrogenase [Pseudolysinimonas yzui]
MDLIEVEGMRVAGSRADLVLGPGEAVLGGGTWLFSEPQPGLRGLVDLTGLGWDPVVAREDGGLSIAATCTLAQARDAAGRFGTAAAVVEACVDALLGSWKIHNIATVGGNICLALPAGPMTSLAGGLGATAVVWTPAAEGTDGGERRIPVADFVTGVRSTVLRPGEVLRAVEFPAPPAWVSHRRASLAPLGRSAALVLARRDGDGFTLTVTASTASPRVFAFAHVPEAAELAAAIAGCDWYDDAHGAADWRRAMTLRFAEELRAEARAVEAQP